MERCFEACRWYEPSLPATVFVVADDMVDRARVADAPDKVDCARVADASPVLSARPPRSAVAQRMLLRAILAS